MSPIIDKGGPWKVVDEHVGDPSDKEKQFHLLCRAGELGLYEGSQG